MRPFYNDVKDRISLPDLVPKTPMNAFYAAYAFVRLKSPDALSEIDRQMADYKLFRGLTIVFALDLLFTLTRGGVEWSRLLFAAVLLVAAAARYQFLLGWTYKITFEYYALLKKAAVREDVLV
jgi:hypothetical protein